MAMVSALPVSELLDSEPMAMASELPISANIPESELWASV
jgi:hypothetical protein